jgi:hypothetical protein
VPPHLIIVASFCMLLVLSPPSPPPCSPSPPCCRCWREHPNGSQSDEPRRVKTSRQRWCRRDGLTNNRTLSASACLCLLLPLCLSAPLASCIPASPFSHTVIHATLPRLPSPASPLCTLLQELNAQFEQAAGGARRPAGANRPKYVNDPALGLGPLPSSTDGPTPSIVGLQWGSGEGEGGGRLLAAPLQVVQGHSYAGLEAPGSLTGNNPAVTTGANTALPVKYYYDTSGSAGQGGGGTVSPSGDGDSGTARCTQCNAKLQFCMCNTAHTRQKSKRYAAGSAVTTAAEVVQCSCVALG